MTAPAVRDGRQPRSDPEAADLVEIVDGVRLYGREVGREHVDGRPVSVTLRMAKRLVDGAWQTSYDVEAGKHAGGAASNSGR